MSVQGSNSSVEVKPEGIVAASHTHEDYRVNIIDANSISKRKIWQWFHPDDGPAERKLIAKLDWYILSFACIGFWVRRL